MLTLNRFPLVLCAATLFVAFQVSPAADWPQFRGPDRTDRSAETGLLSSWPEGGPKQVWLSKDVGLGYSGPAIVKGKIFIMGARDSQEFLICLDEKTGKTLWNTPVGGLFENKWGDGPRGTPSVDGDRVYAMGGDGALVCASTSDGKLVWESSMKKLGGKVPGWGYTESVLVDGDLVLCTPGGEEGTLAALDKMTGQPVWRSKGFTDEAQYASLVPAVIQGEKQYLQLTQKRFAGVSAKDGKLLWEVDWPGRTAVIPTPIVQDNLVYVTSGYGVGCALVRIDPGQKVEEIYRNKVMKNHHGGVIQVGKHLYGHSDGPGWICQDLMTGEEVWAEKDKLGKGAVGYADGKLYCLDERSGVVVLADASPDGWKEHGRFTLSPQTEQRKPSGKIWTHPVIANGKLYLRDQELFFCFDVKAR